MGTPEGSPIRRLLVDMYTYHGKADWLDGQKNVDFLADLAGCLLTKRRNKQQQQQQEPSGPEVNGCEYYYHGEEGGCYSDKIPGHMFRVSSTLASGVRF
jgi:hypothetical protein